MVQGNTCTGQWDSVGVYGMCEEEKADAEKTSDGGFKNDCTGSNHAIQVAGWGASPDGTRYWVARNSWGTYYDENGWFRVKRDGDDGYQPRCSWATPGLKEA